MSKKMVMAVISREQADRALDRLISAGYGATFTESRGGMLRQAQQMIFIATDDTCVEHVVSIIKKTCRSRVEVSEQQVAPGSLDSVVPKDADRSLDRPRATERGGLLDSGGGLRAGGLADPTGDVSTKTTTEVGYAVVFVWDLERFETY